MVLTKVPLTSLELGNLEMPVRTLGSYKGGSLGGEGLGAILTLLGSE